MSERFSRCLPVRHCFSLIAVQQSFLTSGCPTFDWAARGTVSLTAFPRRFPGGLTQRGSTVCVRSLVFLPTRGRLPFGSCTMKRLPFSSASALSLYPRPCDWHENLHVTGYWFLDEVQEWSPPRDLADFLDAGQPPVYVGFGSMSSSNPERETEIITKALEMAGQRGILLTGRGPGQTGESSGFHVPDEGCSTRLAFPGECLPLCIIVARETTGNCLRAGRPAVPVPYFGDQPFWGVQDPLAGGRHGSCDEGSDSRRTAWPDVLKRQPRIKQCADEPRTWGSRYGRKQALRTPSAPSICSDLVSGPATFYPGNTHYGNQSDSDRRNDYHCPDAVFLHQAVFLRADASCRSPGNPGSRKNPLWSTPLPRLPSWQPAQCGNWPRDTSSEESLHPGSTRLRTRFTLHGDLPLVSVPW